MDEDYDYIFKILIIGDSSVGKSSMVSKFADDDYDENSLLIAPTVGVDLHVKIIEVDDKKVKLQLWEIGGNERFRSIVSTYYRNCQGIIMMFDLTNKESFENLQMWMNHIKEVNLKENSGEYCCDDIPKILVGNKKDLKAMRSVSHEEAYDFSNYLNIPYIETSVKDSENINEVFEEISREVRMNRKYCLKNAKSFEYKKNTEKTERSCCFSTSWFTCCF
jgi:Ras-related protein Rab-1A